MRVEGRISDSLVRLDVYVGEESDVMEISFGTETSPIEWITYCLQVSVADECRR